MLGQQPKTLKYFNTISNSEIDGPTSRRRSTGGSFVLRLVVAVVVVALIVVTLFFFVTTTTEQTQKCDRTDNAIKNRYYSTMRRLKRMGLLKTSQNGMARGTHGNAHFRT